MKRSLFLFLLLLSYCGSKKIPSQIRAKVVSWGSSGFEYKVVDFKYLTDAVHMEGSIANIRGGTLVDADLSNDDVIHGDEDTVFAKKGARVRIDYTVKDGVILAKNNDSLEMLSLYHQFELIVDFWITNYNFTLEEIGKFTIHYEPALSANLDGLKIASSPRLNAAYFNGLGDFLLFKTSPLEKIPLKLNIAVLAHEFGHKIFDIRFAQRSSAFVFDNTIFKTRRELNATNEGLADYFSWLLVQNTDLFTRSLDSQIFKERIIPVSWTNKTLDENPDVCTGSYYCKGSILTSALYELSIDPSMTKEKVANAVLSALPKFRNDWDAHRMDRTFDQYFLLIRILLELPSNEQDIACKIFYKWFDDSNNTSGLRQVCK